ncbi:MULTISPECIES: molybdopterin cofactor-binding domain-containing protein [Paraburkholderia]|uniref:molybdopterin cofactor-binding domain-containing protein n=1 Tax=Paraburkholderia TaxID=1822464 RepID=UPI001FECCF36|nr:molybdopterin cofactor-binding domain-containing protein [Paraburkholderia podalyriae]
MKPTAFSYHRPSTLDDALSLLALHGFDAKLIAGGQSLAPMMNMRFAQPARRAYLDPTALPQGLTPGLEFHLTYDPPAMTYSNAAHGCEIEVDVLTGAIRIARYVIAEDCGTLLNPTVVEGQQHGAVAMGLSGALFEHMRYDDSGQNVTGSLADYLIATSTELPNSRSSRCVRLTSRRRPASRGWPKAG